MFLIRNKESQKMRVLQINTVYPYGSTGKIAKGIHDLCIEQGINVVTACRYKDSDMPDLDNVAVS